MAFVWKNENKSLQRRKKLATFPIHFPFTSLRMKRVRKKVIKYAKLLQQMRKLFSISLTFKEQEKVGKFLSFFWIKRIFWWKLWDFWHKKSCLHQGNRKTTELTKRWLRRLIFIREDTIYTNGTQFIPSRLN